MYFNPKRGKRAIFSALSCLDSPYWRNIIYKLKFFKRNVTPHIRLSLVSCSKDELVYVPELLLETLWTGARLAVLQNSNCDCSADASQPDLTHCHVANECFEKLLNT